MLFEMATSTLNGSVASHRASGRVRKQPDMYTSRTHISSTSKRKRSNEQEVEDGDDGEDVEMPDESSADEDAEGDDEPDEEELREKARQARKSKGTAPRKPAQKKPKVNGTTLPIRNGTTSTKQRPTKATKTVDITKAKAAGGLYAEVFATADLVDNIAVGWLDRFKAHESSALAEIINFALKCAGCDGIVTQHDIEDPDDATNKLDDLREAYQATKPTDYPLVAKGKAAAAFRQSITGFVQVLIKTIAAKDDLLFTIPELVENVQVWFSAMSSAPNRAFRHTSTVLSLAIVTALCEIAQDHTQQAANYRRQLEKEREKARVNHGRVKDIEQKMKSHQQKQEYSESLLKDWFDVVFIHRYRDIDHLIRRDCVTALGDWILKHRDVFFDGQHLRYLGWVLSDTNATTRGEVLKQLHRLYKNEDMLGGLKTFTEKFRGRLVEIATTDAETSVRCSGIELLSLLREGGLLEPDDIDAVGRLVYDNDLRVRKSVASFFAENVKDLYSSKLDDLGGLEGIEDALPEIGEGNYDAPRLEWLELKSLSEMLQSYDVDEGLLSHVERVRGDGGLVLHITNADTRFTLAADILYDRLDTIKDWQTLAGYLLFDHSSKRANGVANDALSQLKHECILAEREDTILLEVLHASVKRAVAEQAEKLTAPKSKLSTRQKEQLQEELDESARLLASLIPRLLKKFGDIPSQAAAVLKIESVLNLPSLQDLRQDSATYGALLDDVRKQFMSHGTDEVLGPASTAILHAKSYGELDDLTEEKVTALWDDVISNLTELVDPRTVTVRGASSSEEMVALSNNLLRIIRLATVSNCVPPLEDATVTSSKNSTKTALDAAIDCIIALVQRAVPTDGPQPDPDEAALEDEIAARAAEAALFYFRWQLKFIISTVTTSTATDITFEMLESIATRRDQYAENLKTSLESRKSGEEISMAFAGNMLELYSNSAILGEIKPKPGMSDDYTVLVMDLGEDVQKMILKTLSAAEKLFAKLSGRKIEESVTDGAADDVNADPIDDDPESDLEDEDEEIPDAKQRHTLQQRQEAKALSTLLAERKLCSLAGKIIHALAAGVMDGKVTRERLERNKARLGPNYKECIAYLDVDKKNAKAKAKGKAKKPLANGVSKAKPDPKSHAIVAEDKLDDEIEDANDDDEEALRRRELVNDEPEPEEEDVLANGVDDEAESVLGD